MTEPITTLTDYLIAVESILFALLLLHRSNSQHHGVADSGDDFDVERRTLRGAQHQSHPAIKQCHRATRLWAAAFCFVAVAALSGGTYHGFVVSLGNAVCRSLWKLMIYSLSFASFFMVSATIYSTVSLRLQRWLFPAIVLKSLVYLSWATVQSYFGYVIADYLSAMAIVLLLHLKATVRSGRSIWVVLGVLISCAAAGIQGSRLEVPNTLNSNDLYHLVQMVALFCFYQGACLGKL